MLFGLGDGKLDEHCRNRRPTLKPSKDRLEFLEIPIVQRLAPPARQRSYGATFNPAGKTQADIRPRPSLNDPALIQPQPRSTNPTLHVFDSRRLHFQARGNAGFFLGVAEAPGVCGSVPR